VPVTNANSRKERFWIVNNAIKWLIFGYRKLDHHTLSIWSVFQIFTTNTTTFTYDVKMAVFLIMLLVQWQLILIDDCKTIVSGFIYAIFHYSRECCSLLSGLLLYTCGLNTWWVVHRNWDNRRRIFPCKREVVCIFYTFYCFRLQKREAPGIWHAKFHLIFCFI